MKILEELYAPLSILLILLLKEAYGAVLVCILFWGFYAIVVNSKKYSFMKNYIERFF